MPNNNDTVKGGKPVWTAPENYSDEAYLRSIEQYKDKPWYDRLLTNPWLASRQADYTPSFWTGIAENVFNDWSARQSYYANIMSEREQWLSDKIAQMEQQDYDSPLEQVKRQQAAGLNPDLNGNVTSGASAENDQPIQPLSMPQSDTVQSIASTGLQFIGQIMSMAQSFQGLKLGKEQLVQAELSSNERAKNYVLDQIAGQSFFRNADDIDSLSPEELAGDIIRVSKNIDYRGYSPGLRKLIKRYFGTYSRDVRSGKFPMAVEDLKSQLRSRIASNNKTAVESAGSPMYNEDFDVFLRDFAEIMGQAEYDAQLESYKASKARSSYDSIYFHSLDPSKQAGAENDSAEAASATSKQTAIVEGMWKDVYKLCSESKTWYGTLGLLLIPIFRSMASNMSFGVGRYGKDSGKFGITGFNF